MEEHEATFEVDSQADARALERMLDRLYDSLREESRTVREGSSDSTEMLAEFEAICEAARRRSPGRLTVVYERREGDFED